MRIKSALLFAHRWLSLALAPLFLLMLLSAAVLAFRPIVEEVQSPPPVDAPALVRLLDQADPQGRMKQAIVSRDGQTLTLRGGGPERSFAIATGEPAATPFDLFDFAKKVHVGLLVGAGWLVTFGAFAMTAIVLVGPLLSWPRLRNTLLGWHRAIGWFLFPLVLILPLTGALVSYHVGMPPLPPLPAAEQPVPLARGIERAHAEGVDLTDLVLARSFRGGNVRLTTRGDGHGQEYHLASADAVEPMTGAPGVVRRIHEGNWGGAWSGLLNLLIVLALLALSATGTLSWARRLLAGRRRDAEAMGDAEVLVAWASQTGTAMRLAEATAATFRDGGEKVAACSLAAVAPEELVRMRHVLLVVSTTGDGEVPDEGASFLRKLQPGALEGAAFSLLALGDRRYGEERFCAGGKQVREALLAAGATEELPLRCADDDPRQAWEGWLEAVVETLQLSSGRAVAVQGDTAVQLQMVAKERLDDPADPVTAEVWALTFESATPLDFRPGDLLMVPPPNGGPARPYSIGSSPLCDPRRILLTVALTRTVDGEGREQLGAASGFLCRQLQPGDRLDASLRSHPSFHPPQDPARPVILVAAGCGIAPFVGFLEERAALASKGERPGPAWLVFGNRHERGDFLHRAELEGWREAGALTRLDTAFSRDPGGGYVQDRLRASGADLLDWMERKDAALFLCGRATTLGKGVERALREILVEQQAVADAEEAAARIAGWEAKGSIHRDLFD